MSDEWWVMEIEWLKKVNQTGLKPLSRQRRRSSSNRSWKEDCQMGCYRQHGGDNGTMLMTAVTQEQEQVSKLLRERREIIWSKFFFACYFGLVQSFQPKFDLFPSMTGMTQYSWYLNWYETNTFLYRRQCEIFRPYRFIWYKIDSLAHGAKLEL